MIFTCSMSDFFHEKISDEQRDLAISTIRRAPQHTYQILTKRSYIMKQYGDRIGGFPRNIWLGVSVEDARFNFRTEHLRQADAATKFLSIEPLIGTIGKVDLEGINWVIAGGESGPNHRPLNLEWAREIRDQCVNQGVAFFFKQVGGAKPKSGETLGRPRVEPVPRHSPHDHCPMMFGFAHKDRFPVVERTC